MTSAWRRSRIWRSRSSRAWIVAADGAMTGTGGGGTTISMVPSFSALARCCACSTLLSSDMKFDLPEVSAYDAWASPNADQSRESTNAEPGIGP